MPNSLEQSESGQEIEGFQKPTLEQLYKLSDKIHALPDISYRISSLIHHIDRIQHEATTGDDSPDLYRRLGFELKQLNKDLAELPDSIEI